MATITRIGNVYNSIQRSVKRVLNSFNPNIQIQILICRPSTLEVVSFQC